MPDDPIQESIPSDSYYTRSHGSLILRSGTLHIQDMDQQYLATSISVMEVYLAQLNNKSKLLFHDGRWPILVMIRGALKPQKDGLAEQPRGGLEASMLVMNIAEKL